MHAKLVRFYNFSHKEIETMTAEQVESYWRSIDVIEARESLLYLKNQSVQYMKQDRAGKYFKKLEEIASNKKDNKVKVQSFADLANFL